jgi:hypothetical protein
MKREMGKLEAEAVIVFQFLDTPGDEITPGSNEIGENFQNQRFRHDFLLSMRSATSHVRARR